MIETITAGDTARFAITIVDAAGAPSDITGAEVVFGMRAGATTIEATATVTNAVEGMASVEIAPSITADMAPGLYETEAEVRSAGGAINSVVLGRVMVREGIVG